MRRLLIWLISLAAVLGVYFGYRLISGGPPIDLGVGSALTENGADANMGAGGAGGKIGGVTVNAVEQNKFQHRDRKTGRVDREFGFAELLHKNQDVWEIERPYMNIFQRSFECRVRADRGQVQVESAVRNPTAKDATFTGNVVVHIVPNRGSKIKESLLYLDEVVFLSERSQFSTSGPVRFESSDSQMTGRGLDLIYDAQTEMLEYVRLRDLESLHYRGSKGRLPGKDRDLPGVQASGRGQMGEKKPAETAQGSGKVSAGGGAGGGAAKKDGQRAVDPNAGAYYMCVLLKNVVIESQEQVVLADNEVVISDIFWSKGSGEEPNAADANDLGVAKAAAGGERPGPDVAGGKYANAADTAAQKAADANVPGGESLDVVVTCDGGVVLLPMDSKRAIPEPRQGGADANTAGAGEADGPDERARFHTHRLEHDARTGDVTAVGPSDLVFYTSEAFGGEPNQTTVPVKVTARDGVKFFQESNKAVFEGGSEVRIPQRELSVEREARLSSPRLTVNLPKEQSAKKLSVRDIFADGPVELTFYAEEPNDPNRTKGKAWVFPVTVTAQEGATFVPDANEVVFDGNCVCTMPWKGGKEGQNYTLASPKLTVDLAKGRVKGGRALPNVLAAGPAELKFLMDDFGAGKGKPKKPLAGTLTAKKEARFSAGSGRVVFDGDCECQVIRSDPNFDERYILAAPEIAADMPRDTNDRKSMAEGGIEHLTAGRGLVTLAQVRMVGKQVLGGIMLMCRQFDYGASEQLFTAAGPGEIRLNNSRVPERENDPNRISLVRPCYASLRNFDRLQYFADANQIVPDANSDGALVIDYLPVVKGKVAGHIVATAKHAEVNISKTAEGLFELSTLKASKGITYQDQENEFFGSDLFYDHQRGFMKVRGDATQACYFNGAIVDSIEYDLKTGKVKAEVVQPGVLQLNPDVGQLKRLK